MEFLTVLSFVLVRVYPQQESGQQCNQYFIIQKHVGRISKKSIPYLAM